MCRGGTAVAYAIFYAVVVIPDIPLGIALFGRRHPAAWIGGALIGYGLAQILVWLVIESRFQSAWAFAASWFVLLGVSWALLQRPSR